MGFSFAEGLKNFFTKGAFVKRCRMTPQKKEAILQMINDTSEKTCYMDEDTFVLFMKAKSWLEYQLGESNIKESIDIKTAYVLRNWMDDFDNYQFSPQKDYPGAYEWIMNKLSKKWSLAEISLGEEIEELR